MKITAAKWGVYTEKATITGPLFSIPEVCTVHVCLESGDLQGFGFAYCWHSLAGRALHSLGLLMSPAVVGTEISDWMDVSATIERQFVNFLGTDGMAAFVHSALDMAIWDLAMKARGLSLQAARNRPERPAPCYLSHNLRAEIDPAELQRRAAASVAEGYRAVKMWVSNRDLGRERDRVAAVRESIGPDIDLLIDAQQVLTPRQAVELGDLVADFKPGFLEDPNHKDDLDGLAWITQRSAIPIAAGENAYGINGLKRLLDSVSLHSVLIDLQRVGGITGWDKAQALCAANNVRATTHVFPHTGARLLAGCSPAEGLVEYSLSQNGKFGPPDVRNGAIVPNPTPGATPVPIVAIEWTTVAA